MDDDTGEKLLSPEDFLSSQPEPEEEEGRYRLVSPAGRGGTATVWRAEEVASGRVVALKLLAGEDSPRRRARIEREARALLAVRHPAVVPLLDAGSLGGRPFLVFPWIEQRETLRGLLARGPLPPRRAVEIVAVLADALARAHAAGVAHRNLKPENVLLEPGGGPLLVDFGLARGEEWSPLTKSGDLLGTPGYMSPEQVCGAVDSQGPASDVHALGVLLHELLTGRLPWAASTVEALLRAIESTEPAPPGVDPALDAVCRACLVKDPERRPAAGEVQQRLAAWLERGGASAARRWLVPLAVLLGAPGLALALVLLGRPATLEPAGEAAPPTAGGAALDSGSAAAWRERSRARSLAGDPAGALADCDQALALDPADTVALLQRAVLRRGSGDTAGALADLGRVIDLDRRSRAALVERGALRLATGDAAGARSDYERALAQAPDDLPALLGRAETLVTLGESAAALADLERALEVDPGHAPALVTRGALHQSRGDLAAALRDFDRAVELAPSDVMARISRGVVRSLLGDEAGARVDLEQALAIDPNSSLAHNHRGALRGRAGDAAGALADFEKAIELGPREPSPRANRAILREAAGDLQAALAELEATLPLTAPGSPIRAEVEANLARVRAKLAR